MRLLIGTMYTIENEFNRCVESIRMQDYRNYEHIVIRNMANRAAHHMLYRTFMERSDEFDLLVKVDADMVLSRSDLFSRIVEVFRNRAEIEQLEIALNDWFPQEMTWGLNSFRNTVRWPLDDEDIFVDDTPVPVERHVWDRDNLAPAAEHCPDPSPLQAFHYGVHRAIKVVQPGKTRYDARGDFSRSQWAYLEKTWKHYKSSKDRRLCLATLGAELTFCGIMGVREVDYTFPKMAEIIKKYEGVHTSALEALTRYYRLRNWGIMPSNIRIRAVCHPEIGLFPSLGLMRVLMQRFRQWRRKMNAGQTK